MGKNFNLLWLKNALLWLNPHAAVPCRNGNPAKTECCDLTLPLVVVAISHRCECERVRLTPRPLLVGVCFRCTMSWVPKSVHPDGLLAKFSPWKDYVGACFLTPAGCCSFTRQGRANISSSWMKLFPPAVWWCFSTETLVGPADWSFSLGSIVVNSQCPWFHCVTPYPAIHDLHIDLRENDSLPLYLPGTGKTMTANAIASQREWL